MYRVSEVAKILGITRATVYNKINCLQEELTPFVYIKKGIKHIDDRGLEVIRKSLSVNKDAKDLTEGLTTPLTSEKAIENESVGNTIDRQAFDSRIDTIQKDYIENLKVHIEELKNELQIKNDQLKRKDELIINFQILLKEDKDRILLLEKGLEEKAITKDQQTIITAEIMKQVKEENKKLMDHIAITREELHKKSFWGRIFRK